MGIVLVVIAAPTLLVLTVFLIAVCCFRSVSGKSRSAVGTFDEQSPLLIADRQEQERGRSGHEPNEQQDVHSYPPAQTSRSEKDNTQRSEDKGVLKNRLNSVDAHQVCSALWEARAKWYAIGLELQIDSGELDTIQRRYLNNPDKCVSEMTDLWLRQSADPHTTVTAAAATWENLIAALRQPAVGCGELADSIMAKLLTSDGGGSSSVGGDGGDHGVTRLHDRGSHQGPRTTYVPSGGIRVYPITGVAPLIQLGTGVCNEYVCVFTYWCQS